MSKIISIITPFFCVDKEEYIFNRAKFYIENSYSSQEIERILVDQGSPQLISKEIKSLCERNNFKYINLGRGNLNFSIGMCRNHGVQVAQGKFISFSDIDLFSDDNFYNKLINKLKNDAIPYNHLELIPCFYLSPEGTEQYLQGVVDNNQIYAGYMSGDSAYIDMVAPASSCLIVRKEFYLAEGGVSEEFFGHGYEDFELMNRLAIKAKIFHRSHDYYSHDFKYDSEEYKGYRTFFAMHGRVNLSEKFFYVHLYHKTVSNITYKNRNKENKKIFERLLKEYDVKRISPPALSDLSSSLKTLVVAHKESLGFKAIREALPKFGNCIYRHEDNFESIFEFQEYLINCNFDVVLFSNPYGNDHRLSLYIATKEAKVKTFCFDRGALPNSWFFDPEGFNAGSASYSESRWNKDLNEADLYKVQRYINSLCSSDEVLEKNGARIGAYSLKRKINAAGKKILFVPLQRPQDSVIKYFSGNVVGVDDFAHQISIFAKSNKDWVVVVKKHPLEKSTPEMDACIFLDPDTHVHDILEVCDAVALINSGVGLLSLCFQKPVYCFGKAFYESNGLAIGVKDWQELSLRLQDSSSINYEMVLKFVHYLVYEFYSFGSSAYREVDDGVAKRTELVDLAFERLSIDGLFIGDIQRRSECYSTKSPYYDYHRSYFKMRERGGSSFPSDSSGDKIPKNNNSNNEKLKSTPNVVPPEKVNQDSVVALNPKRKELTFNSNQNSGAFGRKFRKLIRDPKLFFKDAFSK